MKRLLLMLLVLAVPVGVAGGPSAEGSFTMSPVFDLRVRQEILDGVFHFAAEPDRNWLRIRTRAGATGEGE